MKKIILLLNLLVFVSIIFTSCNNEKSYAERLAEEKDHISKLLSDSFVVIPFNKDSLYTKANRHIMQLSNGSYLAIISKGNMGDTAVAGTVVTYRFRKSLLLNDYTYIDNIQSIDPCKFVYSKLNPARTSFSGSGLSSCPGLQAPMEFLGNGAVVKLIIPSKISYSDMEDISVVNTVFFNELTYKFSLQN
ncbi:MAG: DUF4827 family protein [Bacteroidales bacterium]